MQGNSADLGSLERYYGDKWKNLYLSGDISDVTNSVKVADIVKKDQLPTKTSQLTNDSGYQTASDVSTAVSTAISGQTKETLQFVLSDGTVVTKTFVLG